MKNQFLLRRFGFAVSGMRYAWRREKSFRTEVVFAALAIAVVIVAQPGLLWTALILVSIALVLALELLNSSLEYLMDHLHPHAAPEIKAAKDIASAAVLVANTSAILIAVLAVWSWLRG